MDVKKGGTAIARIALFTALIATCAWIAVPMPSGIGFTLQTMGVCLAGGFLGVKSGTFATVAYILSGMIGAPVFSGFTGGMGIILSPVGGYIVGFLFTAFSVGLVSDLVEKRGLLGKSRAAALFGAMVFGILLCYLFGTAWFMIYFARSDKAVSLGSALLTCVVPYILPDLFKAAAGTGLCVKLKKYL